MEGEEVQESKEEVEVEKISKSNENTEQKRGKLI